MNNNVFIEEILPLTPQQQSSLRAAVGRHNENKPLVLQKMYRLQGRVNVRGLQDAWDLVTTRNPLLRASIHWEGLEKPVMVFHKQVPLPMACRDWSGTPASELQMRLEQECRIEMERGFELEKPPLLRLALLEAAAGDRFLLWTVQRLILDERSVELLMEELWHSYCDLTTGKRTDIPIRVSFKDYLGWLADQNPAESETFWRTNLHGLSGNGRPEIIHMPVSKCLQDECASVWWKMADFPVSQLMAQAGENGLHALIYGAWALLLYHHFGMSEVVFGVTTSGRQHSCQGIDQVCGPLATVVPFRTTVPTTESGDVWFKKLQNQWQQVNHHALWGLDRIREWGGIQQGDTIFDTVISVAYGPSNGLLSMPNEEGRIEELPLVALRGHLFDLRVKAEAGLSLELAYSRRFEAESMQQLLTRFANIMNFLNAQPGQALTSIPVFTHNERSQLHHWSSGKTRAWSQRCLHEAFEDSAKLNPEAMAAILENETITYRQLNSRANQLACHLQKLGVGPEVIVGVFMDRSVETLVAILGILKAGGTYLPLDAELPQERLTFMLQDASPSVLLTKQDFLRELPVAAAMCEVVCLDSDWESISSNSDEDRPQQSPEALAYIIYTSGSTGKPKGVAVPHAAAVNHLITIQEAFNYRKEDRVLQFASLSFDVSIEQILAPLFSGATLVLKSNEPWSRVQFFTAMEENRITVANVPPAYWAQLADEDQSPILAPSALRLMIVGGDAMSPETLRRWQRSAMRQIELLNAYGPTEAVITATLFRVPSDFPDKANAHGVPIGRPLPGRKAFIVNNAEFVPAGFPGELLLGGDCLARGYLNRPDLTAEKFVPDPFSGQAGARLYRTGDIVRFGADGQIEFLGRSDNQVKIRGFRIELEEIELAVLAHPEVRQAVASVRQGDQGEKRLAAYVVTSAGAKLSAAQLRDFLRQKLPEYAVPALVVFLEALPLTPSGKIDRNQLPDAGEAQETAAESHSEPMTPAEKMLMEIWTDVLGTKQIGAHDDFFESGGDSLLATQVMTRVQKAFGFEVPLRVMFESPTIAGLARVIEEHGKRSDGEIELVRVERASAYPLSPAQERLWFLCQMGGQSAIYNMTGMIRLEGNLDVAVLERVLAEIIRRHEALRTVFPLNGDSPVQVVQAPYLIHPTVIDLSSSPESQQDAEIFEISQQEMALPFDLVNGPVFRARLLRFSPSNFVLLSTIHHIACDGWSIAILAKEISVLYGAFLRNEASPLPDLHFQYVDFAHWQRQLLDRTLGTHMEYWRRSLGGCPPPVSLPQEKQNTPDVGFAGESYSIVMSPEVSDGLKALSQRTKTSLFMTLLAGLKMLIFSYTDCEDIVVGADIANRTRIEMEEIIGFFVNILALRTDLSANPTLMEAVSRVREVTLGAFEHQEVPFDRVVEELNPTRTSSLTPLFKVFFDMQRPALELLQLPGLKISHLELKQQTAQFDLTLFAREENHGLICNFNYKTNLFEREAIRRIAHDYKTVLEQMAARPDMRIGVLQSLLEKNSVKVKIPKFGLV